MTKSEKKQTRNLLYNWGCSHNIIEMEQEELNQLKEILYGMADVRSTVYSHVPKSRNKGTYSSVENSFIKTMELCERRIDKLNSIVKEHIQLKEKLDGIISSMDYEMRYVIQSKYRIKMSWDEIVSNYPYSMSLRNFHRIHDKALNYIYNLILKEQL